MHPVTTAAAVPAAPAASTTAAVPAANTTAAAPAANTTQAAIPAAAGISEKQPHQPAKKASIWARCCGKSDDYAQ
jgi:hypothetical protein